MKHLTKALVFVMLAAVLLFAVSACSESEKEPTSDFPNTQRGFKFELSEAVLDISQSFKLHKADGGKIPGATVDVTVEGHPELSYFNAFVTFTWEYEYMNEDGDFETDSCTAKVELDATGSGTLEDEVEFSYRSVQNVQLSLAFEGFAAKK